MFEITGDDIALLNDEDLRAVIARLCEAESRGHGYSTAYVTSGGNQNAADGGVDVRVALPPDSVIDGFIPRPATGFQVKQQDMSAGEITEEMRPKGCIRPSIQDLADQSGAYIIVSSKGSTADTALTSRRNAMRDAIRDSCHADNLMVDFYDRTRIATWVRSHEGLIPWIRSLVGRAIPGWQSYGSWAYAPDSVTAEYLLDEQIRIHPAQRNTDQGLSVLDGIHGMRDELRQIQHVVRLVGLSGVGKTRLVQALFDERVGTQSLDPSLAIYTNMADDPNPQPIGIASDLIADGKRAILVIDNCPSALHGRLSELCRQSKSRTSLITIEYDIREDEPEGTEVFILEGSSPDLIENLVRRRFPEISQVDAHTIAEFSGGNARIAIALAATVDNTETIAGLTDEQLFRRLFLQRHTHDESFYISAQACALVYSFQGEDVSEGDTAELAVLGRLIGTKPQDIYRAVAELQRRDLVQQRSVWRAVLPPAIANRLAATALQNIPYLQIEKHLIADAPARLMESFSRRLGYLHASKEAVEIVRRWLGVNGLLGNVGTLNDSRRVMFENVAPCEPESALAALERALLEPWGAERIWEYQGFFNLIRHLAYEPSLFERCVILMVKILSDDEVKAQSHHTQLFISLFHPILSGTHAAIEQRANVIKSLLASRNPRQRTLGVLALKAALEAMEVRSVGSFEFGAHSRNFGYWPRTNEDVQHWFSMSLKVVEAFVYGPMASEIRAVFAEKFRWLWLNGEITDELVSVCKKIGGAQFWPEGWLAIRQTLALDAKGMDPERLGKLTSVETELRPVDLVQKVRAVVFSTGVPGIDFEDFVSNSNEDIDTRMEKTEALARELGESVAGKKVDFAELIPELVVKRGRLRSFGQGLFKGAVDIQQIWNHLVAALAATDETARNPEVLMGFLNELAVMNRNLTNTLLDTAVEDETLAGLYPLLQTAVRIKAEDIARLKRSVALGKAPTAMYQHLAYGSSKNSIPAPDLQELVLAIAAMPSGYSVAVEILFFRLYSDKQCEMEIAPELVELGCQLLEQSSSADKDDHIDYRLGEIAKFCLKCEKGALITAELCRRLKSTATNHMIAAFYADDLLAGVASAQPIAFLDGLCGGDSKELELGIRILRDINRRKHPLDVISDQDLVDWCDQDPQVRYAALAQVITICERTEKQPPRWSPIALRFLEKAPDKNGMLPIFIWRFRFTDELIHHGSFATILESKKTLLDQLGDFPSLDGSISKEKEKLNRWIDEERRRETEWSRQKNERFE